MTRSHLQRAVEIVYDIILMLEELLCCRINRTDNPNVSVTGVPQSKPEATKSSTSCTSSKTLVTCSLPSDVHFKLIDNLFPDTDINEVHPQLLCINRNCTGFSKAEKNRQSHLKEKKTITISNMNSQLS